LTALPSYIAENWSSTTGDFADIKARFPAIATTTSAEFIAHCHKLNSENNKFPPWKTLQGLLWRQSYESGSVKAPLYEDVLPALETLKTSGIGIYIYSSGSIEAQKLLFANTNHGDITHLINGCIPNYSLPI
jgi:enolase-phosphatase E1